MPPEILVEIITFGNITGLKLVEVVSNKLLKITIPIIFKLKYNYSRFDKKNWNQI